MSNVLHLYATPNLCTAVALPFAVEEMIADWSALRTKMARQVPASFARDEWAYLISFLDRANLSRPFYEAFGEPVTSPTAPIQFLMRPRGSVGIWLPNNVSLLGPLTLILLSLTGNSIKMKGGSESEDLTSIFLDFARKNLPSCALLSFLDQCVNHEVFDRSDVRNEKFAAKVQVRIVFGSDEAAEAVHRMPHPVDSVGFSFSDRRSEAWLETSAATDELLIDLINVFAIYGQAGCTSPRRVVLLDASLPDALALRDRIAALLPQVIRQVPAPHIASDNIMARQCAAAYGWNAALTEHNGAMLACGAYDLEEFAGQMTLMIVPASVAEAASSLPPNIQTVGYGFAASDAGSINNRWLELVARSGIKRLVPIARMHHFGPVWDGQAYWRQSFETVEIQQ